MEFLQCDSELMNKVFLALGAAGLFIECSGRCAGAQELIGHMAPRSVSGECLCDLDYANCDGQQSLGDIVAARSAGSARWIRS